MVGQRDVYLVHSGQDITPGHSDISRTFLPRAYYSG